MKFQKLFIISLIATLFIGLTSCSKDEDDAITLSGTTWKITEDTDSITMSFTSDVSFTYVYSDGEEMTSKFGTYEYTPPTISVKFDGGEAVEGRISGKTMYIGDLVLTKQ
ncbi:MAG: hypothetical protein ABF273_03790 [Wenyingzhuangia sp.]|uniref:hypothetical protein n=1 Tax=Wenyingzhuangia sp. TaxID=1964193 RepID=UPI003219FAEB